MYLIGGLKIGGAQRYCLETATRIDQSRFEPKIHCLFTDGPLRNEAEQRGVPVHVFERADRLFWRMRAFWSVYRYLKREQPDIVHCYMFKPSLYGGFAAKMAGVSVLLTNRTSLGLFKDAMPFFYQMMENVVNRFTDAVLVNSLAEKDDVLQRERLAPEKLHLIYNGVDTEAYQPDDSASFSSEQLQIRRTFEIPDAAPVVGMLANLKTCKGYREFILAAAEVSRVYPDVKFLCIGRDLGAQAELERLIQRSGIQQQVVFTGHVKSARDILPLLNILVSASYEEGFSNAILEAMASGKPIVATAVGGTPEAIQHEQSGLLIPPKDENALAQAILRLLRHPELASRLGRQARKYAEEHFSMEQMLNRIESLYQACFETTSQ